MADTLGSYSVDFAPFLEAIDRAETRANGLTTAIQQAGQSSTAALTKAAQDAVAYSDRLAGARAEQVAVATATRDATGEMRRLVAAGQDLKQALKTSDSAAEAKRLRAELEKNRQALVQVRTAIRENQEATEKERQAVAAVVEARRQEANQTKLVTAAAKEAAAAVKAEGAASQQASQAAGGGVGFLGGLLGKATGLFAGFFAVSKLKQLGSEVIETTAEFQRLEAVLTTINNGDEGKGKLEFATLRAFTLKNPFEVKAVTEGYVTLRNVGINPTIAQLQALADLAAASGKGFDTVTSSLLGATTGRFVQLKQFGITAKQQGDTVSFTFRGVTTVVEKTQKAISDYVFGLGQLNTVHGATERIMNTTGGRITNLKDSFTELFNTIGEGTDGPVNRFIKRLTEIATATKTALQTPEQRATDLAAPKASDYAQTVAQQFAAVAARAKADGKDVGDALKQALQDQTRLADLQLSAAKRAREAYKKSGAGKLDGINNQLQDIIAPTGFQKATLEAVATAVAGPAAPSKRAELEARINQYRQQKIAAKEAFDAALKGGAAEIDQLGLIEALQAKIKKETEDRAASTSKAEIHKFNLQIIADEKALDALLEKQAKTRQKQAGSYESQLRALLQERATLTSLAAKAEIRSADDAAGAAKASFEESLRQVDAVKAKLEQRERDLATQARKVGGRRAVAGLGEKADGQIDGVQEDQLRALRLAALDKYYTDLYKITEAREQRLFDLRADDDAKEVEAIDRKYDKLIKADTDGMERQSIETNRQREQLALKATQEAKRIQQAQAAGTAGANVVGQTFGTGTGVSVFEAARAEKKLLLDIEKKAAEDSLNNTLNKTGKEAEIERAALRAQLLRIQHQQADLATETKRSEFSIYKLVLGEKDNDANRKALNDAASSIISSISTVVAAEQAAAQAQIDFRTQNINELTGQLAAQIQLNKDGAASNIGTLLAQIEEEKAARRKAVEDKRKAQREEAIINGLQQASALATAAANLILGWSGLPIVGQILGAVSVAAMLASFVAAQTTARSAATQGFFKGGFTGTGNPREESQAVGPRPYAYHKGEFVFDHEKTAALHHALFAPIHEGQPGRIDWAHPNVRELLPDMELPGQLRREKADAQLVLHQHSFAPMQAEIAGLRSELAEIKGHVQRTADRPDVVTLPNGDVMEYDSETGSYWQRTLAR